MTCTLVFRALNCLIVALMVCAGSWALAQDAIEPSPPPAATKLSVARRITLDEAKDQAVNAASSQVTELTQWRDGHPQRVRLRQTGADDKGAQDATRNGPNRADDYRAAYAQLKRVAGER